MALWILLMVASVTFAQMPMVSSPGKTGSDVSGATGNSSRGDKDADQNERTLCLVDKSERNSLHPENSNQTLCFMPVCNDKERSCAVVDNHGWCASITNGLCSCDINCILYGDCCHDYFGTCLKTSDGDSLVDLVRRGYLNHMGDNYGTEHYEQRSYFKTHSRCYSVEVNAETQHLRMIGSCPVAYSGERLAECENASVLDSPVSTKTLPEITFRNKHCAYCHGFETSAIVAWDIKGVHCPQSISNELDYKSLLKFITNKLNNCIINVNYTNISKIRRCFPFPLTCGDLSNEEDIRNMSVTELKCHTYLSPVKERHNVSYKNEYCAICVGESVNNLTCSDNVDIIHGQSPDPDAESVGVNILFNFDSSDIINFQIDNRQIRECTNKEQFIPLTGECKHLHCPPGQILDNGACKRSNQQYSLHEKDQIFPNSTDKYHVTFYVTDCSNGTANTGDTDPLNASGNNKDHNTGTGKGRAIRSLVSDNGGQESIGSNTPGPVHNKCEDGIEEWLTVLSGLLQSNEAISLDLTGYSGGYKNCAQNASVFTHSCISGIIKSITTNDSKDYQNLTDISYLIQNATYVLTLKFHVESVFLFKLGINRVFNGLVDKVRQIPFVARLSNFQDILLECPSHRIMKRISNIAISDLYIDGESYLTMDNVTYYSLKHLPYEEVVSFSDVMETQNTVIICADPIEFPKCLSVVYERGEYEMINDTILINEEQIFPEEDQYAIINGSLHVCVVTIINASSWGNLFTYSKTESIISYILLGISILSLLLTIVVYSIIPSLRNVPGKCIMALSVTLLLAQTGLFFTSIEYYEICFAIAVTLHYLWLSSFCWMMTISYDFNRTFGSQSINSGGSKKINVYCITAWVLPALFTGGCVLIDKLQPAGFYIGYGQGEICWITLPLASVYFFALPILIMLIINICCLVRVVVALERSTSQSTTVLNKQADRRRLFMYLRMSSVMGLTWIFGFVVAFTGITIIKYFYMIFNSLQGLFIALSFLGNSRIIKKLTKKSKYETESAKYTRTTSNTIS